MTARAQSESTPTPEIRVTGEATASAKPDVAEVRIGVVTRAANAEAAARDNATKLEAVISAIRASLPDASLETQSYSIQPEYHRPRDEEPRISGYVVTNVLRVHEIPIDATGQVVDAATGAGANDIRGLEFRVWDEESLRLTALGEAAKNARARADALAEALGLTVVRILSVSEGQPVTVRPYAASARMMQAEAAPTPVEPGDVEVRATVTLLVEVRPR